MDTDLQLLGRYRRARDADAFATLVQRHSGLVYAAARRITGNEHTAEDLAQEIFMELARKAEEIRTSLPGWLHAVTTSRAISSLRSEASRKKRERAQAVDEDDSKEATWEQIAPHVDQALAELPASLRDALVGHYLQGRSQVELAAQLDTSQATVSRRLHQGVEELRKKLRTAGVVATAALLASLLPANAVHAAPPTLSASLGKMAISGVGPAKSTWPAWVGVSSPMGLVAAIVVGTAIALSAVYIARQVVFGGSSGGGGTGKGGVSKSAGKRSTKGGEIRGGEVKGGGKAGPTKFGK